MIRHITDALVALIHDRNPDLDSGVVISLLSHADSAQAAHTLAVALLSLEEHGNLGNRPLGLTPDRPAMAPSPGGVGQASTYRSAAITWTATISRFDLLVDGKLQRRLAVDPGRFVENGGPAAYVVRVDPSLPSSWTVRDVQRADAFEAMATSPGSWSHDETLAVVTETTAGMANHNRATVTASVRATSSAAELPVDSVAGVSVDDAVVLIRDDAATTTASATVTLDMPTEADLLARYFLLVLKTARRR